MPLVKEVTFLGMNIRIETLVQLGILTIVNLVTFQGLKNPQYFGPLMYTDLVLSKEMGHSDRSVTQKRKDIPESEVLRTKAYVEHHKPSLGPDLNLTTLAELVGIHQSVLSQLINQYFEMNFSEYINGLRIEEAKQLLGSHQENQLSIKEIMYQCGFNSRSVFNTFFKKKEGVTPSEYLARSKQGF